MHTTVLRFIESPTLYHLLVVSAVEQNSGVTHAYIVHASGLSAMK